MEACIQQFLQSLKRLGFFGEEILGRYKWQKGVLRMNYWIIIGEGGGYEEVKKLRPASSKQDETNRDPNALNRRVLLQDDITFTVGGGETPRLFVNGQPAEAPDVFLLWGHFNERQEGINDCLLRLGAKSVNPIEGKRIACSKLKTAAVLDSASFPQAKTMAVGRDTDPALIEKELGIPVVVKPSDGAQGEGVQLIKTRQALEALLKTLPERTTDVTLAQEYIAASRGRDVRVTVIDHKFRFAIIRMAGNPEEFRSNIHRGGHYSDYDLDPDTIAMCERISRLCNLRICGIDLLLTGSGYVVGEVNCTPGMPEEYTASEAFKTAMKEVIRSTLQQEQR